MKKQNIILFVILGILALFVINGFMGYNKMVSKQEATSTAWAQVENVYQRRLDLIPNLVNTVKGAANFEQKTLTDVINARANATSVKVDASKLSADQISKFQASQGELSQALGRLMVVAEQYPQLKATENFKELQSQLEGTENRIATERQKFNEVVKDYNTFIRKFPHVIYSGWFGFEKKGYFEADKGAEKAPTVSFE
ncbi:MAG: LemA family protein [Bacteroidia bacterium]|nr:LemA family protein [Bacteroidia bacterium]MCC6251843.1 LemA family protein [Bacteroidia bacterium]MCZ2141217.1 LemA family protein [Bacteroidia bacterium]